MKKLVVMILPFLLSAQAAIAQTALETQSDTVMGISFSAYQYEEPGLMSLQGTKVGFDLSATKAVQHPLFLRGEVRAAFGVVDYNSNSTGSATGNPNFYLEARGLVGADLTRFRPGLPPSFP